MRHCIRTALGTGLLTLSASLAGCGGDTTPPPQAAAPPPAPAPPPAQPKPAPPPIAVKPPPKPAEPEQPKRPEDVAHWQPDDFRTARTERDPNLVAAIEALGERSAGDPSVVPLLVELLEVEKPEEPKSDEANADSAKADEAKDGETTPAQPGPRNLAPGGRRLGPAGAPGPAGATGPGSMARGPGARPAPVARPRPPDAKVVAAAIAALGKNVTTQADEVLERLLRGELETGTPPKGIADGVLNALANNPSAPHREMLLTAALTPEVFRAAPSDDEQPKLSNAGGQTPKQLRQDASNKIRAQADAELRTRLAQRLGAEQLAPAEQQAFIKILLEPRPDNVGAQITLFGQQQLDPLVRLQLHDVLSGLAAAAINKLLGIPDDVRIQPPKGYTAKAPGGSGGSAGRGRNYRLGGAYMQGFKVPENPAPVPAAGVGQSPKRAAVNTDEAVALYLAGQLWSPEFVTAVLIPTMGTDSIEKVLPQAMIAAAIPVQESRSTLARLNKGLWDEGTKDLRLGGLFGEMLHDPGLLLVVKDPPRKEEPARLAARAGQQDARRSSGGASRQRAPSNNERDKARYEWMQASEEFVYVLNQRFHAAALANKSLSGKTTADTAADAAIPSETTDGVGGEDSAVALADGPDRPEDDAFGTRADPDADAAAKLPVELHEGASVVAEYHVNWPNDVAGDLAGVDLAPMIIHYVRIEETNRVNKLVSHYQKRLKSAKLRTIDNGKWLDQVDDGSSERRRRSIDVMVYATEPAPAGAAGSAGAKTEKPKNVDEPLVVEILSIEIADPTPGRQTSTDDEKDEESPSGNSNSRAKVAER